MKIMTSSFAAGFVLMLLTVAKAEDSGVDVMSIVMFIISIMLSGVPIIIGKIIARNQRNDLTKLQNSDTIKVVNNTRKSA